MDVHAVRRADRRFFDALLAADAAALDDVLAEDFVIVDVAAGGVTTREPFVAGVAERQIRFVTIDVAADAIVRAAGTAAVVVGRTAMEVALPDGQQVALHSRYTHVFVPATGTDSWRLHSAQGTTITGA